MTLIEELLMGERYVFISHSSQDNEVISAVQRAFDDLDVKPYFVEIEPAGVPPTKKIAEAVKNAVALFAFFTFNSTAGSTLEWIIFELGVAVSHNKPVYTWKVSHLQKQQLPRLLEQVTTYRDFEQSTQGILNLQKEVRAVAKKL